MKINQKENENREENKIKLKSIVFKPDTILIRFIYHSFSKNFKLSSHIIRRIQSNFGSALAIAIGLFIKLLIRKQNLSTLSFSPFAKCYETLAKK